MERRRGSGTIRAAYSATKRFMALFLVAALILTNIGTELNVSYASSGEEVTFQLRGADLVAAVNEAVMDGNEVTAEDLDFTNGKVAQFEQTFFDGGQVKVYEVFPEMEGGSMDAELRIFVRLPEDADDMYTVTGDEELILLYVNNGSESISCNSEIIRIDNGTEKVKKTKRVTVRSYEDAFGDEEINIISKPVEETQAPEGEVQGPAVDGTQGTDNGETAAPTEDTGKSETEAPADSEGTDETESSAEPSVDETDSVKDTEESGEMPSETEKEEPAETEAPETEAHDETEAPEKEAPEKDVTEAEKAEKTEAAEPVASITRHYAPVVADKEEAGGAEKADAPKNEKAPEEKETEAKETEAKETKAKETEPKETEPKETEAKETEPKETETKEPVTKEETAEAPSESGTEAAGEAGTAAPSESEEDMPSSDEGTEASTEAGSSAAEDGKADSGAAGETTDAADMPSVSETAAPSGTETQAPADEETVSKAGTSDLVGMGYCSTAKVYTTTISQLKALDDIEGYKVSYTAYPEASARIVEGARGVSEGESLTFGVKNQAGYEVQSVTANDEEIEAETVTDNEDGSRTVWYTVPEVYEELDVQIYMLENLEHPAFDRSVEVNGVTIRITAPEGVLPANTDIQAEEITEQVAPAVTEVVSAESDNGTSVSTVIAYDINLVYDGMKLDNSWATDENSYVNVSFSGERIAQASKDADEVEILHVETPTETVEAVSAVAELEGNDDNITVAEVPVLDNLTADDITIDSEGRKAVDVSGDASVEEIDFTTSHFSAFTVVFKNAPHLVIANELMEGSTGSENAVYNYEVKLTPGTGRERFYYLAEDGEAVEAKAEDITKVTDDENGSITYSFKLNAGGRVKIGNVSLNAEYQVSQGEVEHNTLKKVSTIETKLDWSEIESENTTVTDKEVFPYGYNEEQGAYGSMMERAGGFMRSYRKCREYDTVHGGSVQRKTLLGKADSSNNDVSNSPCLSKFIKDQYGENGNWELTSGQGLQEVIDAAQKNLDLWQEEEPMLDRNKVNLNNSYLRVYFRVNTSNPDDMEVIPYLTKDNGSGEQWRAYVIYNSSDKSWYQYKALADKDIEGRKRYVGKVIDTFRNKDFSLESLMALPEDAGNWYKLVPGEVNEPDYPEGSNSVEGTFVQSGDLRSITIEFLNLYNLVTDGGNTNIPGDDNPTTPPTDNNNPTTPDDDNITTPPADNNNPTPDDDNTTTPPDDNNTTTQPGDDTTTQPTTPPADTGNGSGNANGSGSGGSSGSGSAGRYQNIDSQSGPGAQMTTITSEDVPLAALPVDAAAEASQAMALIDDGEIPLAAVPKTGDRSDSAHELAFILSGVLLAVYTALGNRKKKES